MAKKKRPTREGAARDGGKMIIYRGPGKTARLEVRLRDETVWLTQKQMAELFSTERSVITKHLHNIFASHELEEKSNVQKMHIPMSDKPVKLYNLDVTISLGYRVNSQRATQFRIWATKILRDHIVRGYTINDQRLREHGERLKELQKAIAFMQSKARQLPLAGQAPELLSVIQDYAASLTLLYEYDRGALALRREKHSRFVLSYDTAYALIEEARAALRKKREASDLFGQEYGDKFKSIIGSLYQTFGGKKLYATVEETTAHLLYLTIKDHPFADGNKRIASLLFIYYLQRTNYLRRKTGERKISDTTLVALALLVAESDPKEKDVMIRLITNLLQ